MSLPITSNDSKSQTTNTRVVLRFRPINSIEKKEWERNVLQKCIKEAQLEVVAHQFEADAEMKDPRNWPKYKGGESDRMLAEKFAMQPGHLRLFKRFCKEFNFHKLDGSDFKDVVPVEVYEEQKQVQILIPDTDDVRVFKFDEVLWWQRDQTYCFRKIAQSVMEDAVQGFNATIFAYGQSGSGKTYTLFGPEPLETAPPEHWGVIPSSLTWIFRVLEEDKTNKFFEVRVSFLEVYLEKLRDLIDPLDGNGREKKLKILELAGGKAALLAFREKASKEAKISAKNKRCARLGRGRPSNSSKKELPVEVIIDNLSEHRVETDKEVQSLISEAARNRTKEKTNLNASSSRSHLIMTVRLVITKNSGTVIKSKINFADLAGSEKVGKTNVKGDRLKEATAINTSLTALRTVIDGLVKQKKYISFRNSKLTRALRDSLGGNTKTTLVLACSPHKWNLEETIETLKFGRRAKFIRSEVIINAQASVEQLQQEISKLKAQNELLKQKLCIEHAKQGIRRLEIEGPRRELETSMSISMLSPGRNKGILGLCREKERFNSISPMYQAKNSLNSDNKIGPIPLLSIHRVSTTDMNDKTLKEMQVPSTHKEFGHQESNSKVKELEFELDKARERELKFTNIVEELMERLDILEHEKEVHNELQKIECQEETRSEYNGQLGSFQNEMTDPQPVECSLEQGNIERHPVSGLSTLQEQSGSIQKTTGIIVNEYSVQSWDKTNNVNEISFLNDHTDQKLEIDFVHKTKLHEENIADEVSDKLQKVKNDNMKLSTPHNGDIDSVLMVLETIATIENKSMLITLNRLMEFFQLAQLSLQTCMHVYTFFPEGKLTVNDIVEVVQAAKLSLRLRERAAAFKKQLIGVTEDFAEIIQDLPSVESVLPGEGASNLTMEDILLVELGEVQSLIFQEGFRFLHSDESDEVLLIDFTIFIEHLVGRGEILGLSQGPISLENVEYSGFRTELLEPITKIFENNNYLSRDGTNNLSSLGSQIVLQEIRESLEDIEADDPGLIILQDLTLPNLEVVVRSCPTPMWHALVEKQDYYTNPDQCSYFAWQS